MVGRLDVAGKGRIGTAVAEQASPFPLLATFQAWQGQIRAPGWTAYAERKGGGAAVMVRLRKKIKITK